MHRLFQKSIILQMVMPRDGDTSRTAAARALSYLFFAAGALGLGYQILLGDGDGVNPFNTVLVANSFVLGLVCARLADQLSAWVLELLLAAGTVMVSSTIYYGGRLADADAFFYLWVCLFAFYFFPWRHAVVHLGLMAGLYALVLAVIHPYNATGQWIIVVGTLVTVGPFVAVVKSHIEALIADLSDAATSDPLTKLVNRRGLEQVFELELERARRGTGMLSLLVGDLDYFKLINDGFGHGKGDEVLVTVAGIFAEGTRQIDTVARMGGEEFAILLPETNAEGALIVAEKLRRCVQSAFESDPTQLTMSFGVATYGINGTSADEMITAGDDALYAAKEMGRNRCVSYSSEVTTVLNQATMHREAQSRTHLATLLTLAEALDLRDTSTGSHSYTVARYAELMARELSMDEGQIERMRLAGLLHDIGKMGVPDSVLWKPGPLTDDEWVQMKRHPEIGARILGPIDFKDIQAWVVAHHERPDGLGYPHGLIDQEIPLGAKVLSVADAYEAMTADRVYRKSMGHRAAQAELLDCVGSHFDERVVEAFLQVIQREGIGVNEPPRPVGETSLDVPEIAPPKGSRRDAAKAVSRSGKASEAELEPESESGESEPGESESEAA